MAQHLGNITLLVADYDEAIQFYVNKLGFELLEDTDRGEGKRWVRVAPAGAGSPALLLAQAATEEQRAQVGNQAGGRVFLFLNTDDFQGDYARYQAAGVQFLEEPRHEDYGSVVVFADLYGNKWDLLQLK
ncbi:VOC family protein [Hymenobacter jeollabukensis]|uniref:VOC family protein n=1 Tax=Hymenobacter jeollabukensis TaxID=2025313 RepID=A0A5R8WQ10_9BACT|nr:VOC family protein [Hymenobacter jeollabukensis]TLM92384.1 VOC family protein [Hymenobacter jeollabukensis]